MHDMQVNIQEIENGILLSITHGGMYPPRITYFKEFVNLLEEMPGVVLHAWHDMKRRAQESQQSAYATTIHGVEPPSWKDKMYGPEGQMQSQYLNEPQSETLSTNEQKRAARHLDADDLNAKDTAEYMGKTGD